MDYVECKIMLGGDSGSIVVRGPTRPVSWPEVAVLQYIHGVDSVFDCKFVRSEPATARGEKDRLAGIYGGEVVELIFPGRQPMMDGKFPGEGSAEANVHPEKKPVPSSRKVAPAAEV
jgi:hypothetical protein